jgi:RNA polymerase sigma-70 factor (ECF subfamily)
MVDVAGWTSSESFADVLGRARAGDERAFAVLWRWLQPPLLRWLAVVSPENVEDVSSDVWLSITRHLAAFDGDEEDFRGWVFTVARRRAIDAARRRSRQPKVASLGELDIADPAVTSSLLVDEASALAAAVALLQQLTPDQREVVALRVIVGMTVRETATVVAKSEGAVRVLCHRGLRTMAARIEAEQAARGAPA